MASEPTDIGPGQEALVRPLLERVEASASFANSRQARLLLRYLVERCFAGDGHKLKGYTIGIEVLGRPADFDPAVDTTVRVAMRRLRKLLADHYAAEGAGDALRLHLDPGDYAPRLLEIGRAAPEPSAEVPSDPIPQSLPPPLPGPLPGLQSPRPRRRPARRLPWLLGAVLTLGLGAALLSWRQAAQPPATDLAFHGQDGVSVRQTTPQIDDTTRPPSADIAPVLRVMPIRAATAGEAAAAETTTRQLRSGLARFSEIGVLDGIAGEPGEAFLLTGQLAAGGHLILELRESATGRIIAAHEARGTPVLGAPGVPDSLRFIVTALAQPYGLILSHQRRAMPAEPEQPGFSCLLRLFDYWRHYDAAQLPAIARCLDATPTNDHAAGPILAGRVLTRLERYRLATVRDPALLEEAYAMARAAVEVTPYDPRVQQALGAVLYARSDARAGIAVLRNARRFNPFDPDIGADLATRLIGVGELEEARALMREACFYVAARPAWMDFYIFLAELLNDNAPGAVDRAGRMTDRGFVLNDVARAIAARFSGDDAALAAAREALAAHDPDWLTDPVPLLARRLPSFEVVRRVAALLQNEPMVTPLPKVALEAGRLGCIADPMR